jgi:hypothetical protein
VARGFSNVTPDEMHFSPGNAPSGGPISVVGLVQFTGNFGWIFGGRNGATQLWTFGRDAGNWFTWNDFSSGVIFNPSSTDWFYVGYSKPAGSNTPTWHFQNYTAGGSWLHTPGTWATGDGSGIDDIQVSGYSGSSTGAHMNGAAMTLAVKSVEWTDLEFEAFCTANAVDLYNATPDWMVRFTQSSVTTQVTDDMGHGGDEISRVGTTVVSDPAGYNSSIAPSTTPVGIQVDLRWSIAEVVGKQVDLRWSIAEVVGKQVDLRWSIAQIVGKQVDLRWSIAQIVNAQLDLRWSVAQQVAAQLDLRWSVAAIVGTQIDLRWAIDGRVKKQLDLRWSISGNSPTPTGKYIVVNRHTDALVINRRAGVDFTVERG